MDTMILLTKRHALFILKHNYPLFIIIIIIIIINFK